MWRGLRLRQPNQWPSDCLTMWCALPTAGEWGPSPDWLTSCITDEQAPPAANPGSLGCHHHVPSINTDTTGHFFAAMHIWKNSRSRQCWIHIFCGFVFVALQQDLREERMDNKQTLWDFWSGGQQPEDVWLMMSGRTVCSERPTLFSSRQKNKTS